MLLKELLSIIPLSLGPLVALRTPAQCAALGPPSTEATCANPPMDQCAFYADCLESRYHCGPNGYPIGYGEKFCQRSLDKRDSLDAKGQQWIRDVMHCVQLALVGDAIDAKPPASDCEALERQAFASHPACYINSGFCTLGVKDWAAVLEIVEIKTLFSNWGIFKATVEITEGCAEFYAFMVSKGLF